MSKKQDDFQGTMPDGKVTTDTTAYLSAWEAVYQPIEQATGARCYGFDPGLALVQDHFTFEIPINFALALAGALANKETHNDPPPVP